VDQDEFIEQYPRLYHMAADGSWPSIREHGLLSTSALLDLFEIKGAVRHALESELRPNSVEISHAKFGKAIVRDQKPMSESALAECLTDGMSTWEWYRLLNKKVFFWPTKQRLASMLGARPYRKDPHVVLTVDTASLIRLHADGVWLSPINSGSTLYNPSPRGPSTFRLIADYPFDERRRARGAADAVAEIAIEYAVPQIKALVVRVHRQRADNVVETLFER
jgi:hypothetical protein